MGITPRTSAPPVDSRGPRVSILLPVRNAASTLSFCLRSILRQSETDWECVLVDDGSNDRSLAIARSFAAVDRRFRIEPRPPSGLVAALNFGMLRCRAPIVARMDADDWMHRDRLLRQCTALDDAPELEAVGAFVRIFPRNGIGSGRRTGRRAYEAWLNSQDGAMRIWRERFIECPIAHPTLAIRRRTLLDLGYRDRNWPEDWDLLLRLMRRGPRVGIVPQRLLGWREHPDRSSRTDPRYATDRFTACRAWHLHRDFLKGRRTYDLWGHGRTGRALRRALSELGHRVARIIEVHPRRLGNTIDGAPVVPPSALEDRSSDPLIVSVAGLGPRSEIRTALADLGFREGIHFVCAA